ncbi:MAG TPA: hypothetical protein VIL86_15880 [Tepidisphaeraceae bacterium]|jgi:hypothetical protein
MKTSIILVLLVALAAAAFFTRPSETSFKDYIAAQNQSQGAGILKTLGREWKAQSLLSECKYQDKYLWVEEQVDGKPAYVGAFSHWFKKGG